MSNYTMSFDIRRREQVEVLVVGGGIAGVASALAARRQGRSVLLLEKTLVLGGLATNGLVVLYNPALCDLDNRVLVRGISEELRALSVKDSYGTVPTTWKQFNNTFFNPHAFALAMEELLISEGVQIIYDSNFVKPVMRGTSCEGIIVLEKDGFCRYDAKVIIDTSGDCEVFFQAGFDCITSDNWLTYWALSISLDNAKTAIAKDDIEHAVYIERLGAVQDGQNQPQGVPKYSCLTSKEITEFVMLGRKELRSQLHNSDRTRKALMSLPNIPQVRDTRRIIGMYNLTEKDRFVRFEDSIGCLPEEVNPDEILEIPYRTLISAESDNIITAGRSISSDGAARDLTRLIATCALTGEAAGNAAAIAVADKCSMKEVSVDKLQNLMLSTGNVLHY